MTASDSTSQYVLGSTDAEQERLIRQAARLDPYTERLFGDAGMGPAQLILDIGSGVGDVAILAARLVGPSGEIVGVERDVRSIARARARVAEAGLHNVTFMQSHVSQVKNRCDSARLTARSEVPLHRSVKYLARDRMLADLSENCWSGSC